QQSGAPGSLNAAANRTRSRCSAGVKKTVNAHRTRPSPLAGLQRYVALGGENVKPWCNQREPTLERIEIVNITAPRLRASGEPQCRGGRARPATAVSGAAPSAVCPRAQGRRDRRLPLSRR